MPKSWFEEIFGFKEASIYSKNQAKFKMDGEVLVCATSKWPPQHVGRFETPSVAELRGRCAEQASTSTDSATGLRFCHIATTDGVQKLIADPANEGAIFMVASQFNCLEMFGPTITPKHGVTIYAKDHTQGPKCAIACAAGTVFRNYLWNGVGQADGQLDCLSDVASLVGNEEQRYWEMKNGYALPHTASSMSELAARLANEEGLAEQVVSALRVGVHWDTQVSPPGKHHVAQVLTSALPVSYDRSTRARDWEPFARLILRGAYEATLAAAHCVAAASATSEAENGCGRGRVYLTALGGGAFGNEHDWIADALIAALALHRDAPLDVILVHYGKHVPAEWAAVRELATEAWTAPEGLPGLAAATGRASAVGSASPSKAVTKRRWWTGLSLGSRTVASSASSGPGAGTPVSQGSTPRRIVRMWGSLKPSPVKRALTWPRSPAKVATKLSLASVAKNASSHGLR